MAAVGKLFNIARMTISNTGTGDLTLNAAATGFLSFAGAGVADGDLVTYGIEDGAAREIGRGTYHSSGTSLTRTTVLKSTNSNAAISASSGAQVFITAAAEDFALTTSPGTSAQIPNGQGAAATPTWNSVSGDVALSAAGVVTLNAQYRFTQPLFLT